MKKLPKLLFLVLLTLSTASHAVDLRVSKYDQVVDAYGLPGRVTYVVIRSAENQPVQIKKAVINRGNCRIFGWYDGRPRLRYGQSIKAMMQGCHAEDIMEVEVTTDQGTETYSFN